MEVLKMNRYEVSVYNLVTRLNDVYWVDALNRNDAVEETKRRLDDETDYGAANHEIYAVEQIW